MKDSTYRQYLLIVLTVITAFSFVDRLALGILAQSIKGDLSLTDTELGLLGGITFALFYATMGLPIARWADHGNRVTIITVTTALWGVAVALCGAARSFIQLVLIRVAVGVGEAGCMPTTNSLIPDYFGRAERARANGIYALVNPLSLLIGYGIAGWVNQLYGWRITFVILGLPGTVLAVLAALTLREPRNALAPPAGPQRQDRVSQTVSLSQICMTLWGNVTFRHLAIVYIVLSFFNSGIFQWLPAFFIRSYGLQTGELGTWFAAIAGVGGFLGSYLGGELASRFAGNREPLQLKVMAAAVVGGTFLSAGIYLTHSYQVAFGLMAVYTFVGAAVNGPIFAIKQTIVSKDVQATAFALVFLFSNLIGAGLGPLAAGVLSDVLHPLLGAESLRYTLVALTPGYLWAACHLWWASQTVLHDVRVTELARDEGIPEEGASLRTSAL